MNSARVAHSPQRPVNDLERVSPSQRTEQVEPKPAWMVDNERNIQTLRRQGVRIGEDCVIFTNQFSLEPYLVEIGDGVAISGGTMFLTHDGAAWLLRRRGRLAAQHFGRIVVGSDTYIGQNCLILPGTTIGAHCIVGAGAVVRGTIPENSVVVGNPGQVAGRTSMLLEMMDASPNTLDTYHLSGPAREATIRRHFGLS
jgi:acetyltransferase-like isoleucine patch superfamily enzyme